MMKKKDIRYYMRKSGTIVRVTDGVVLEYLNSECNWVLNQEWFVSMFVDGEDEFVSLSEEQVDDFINRKLNSKKMMR